MPVQELGTTGLQRAGGYIFEEFLPVLQGTKAIQVYRQMADNDPVVGAFLFTIDMLIRRATPRVEPFDQSDEHVKNAKFVEECIEDLNPGWAMTLSEMLSMLTFGWSWMEICYKKRDGDNRDPDRNSKHTDGKTGWSKFAIRSQDSWQEWTFTPNGRVTGWTQQAPPDYTPIFLPRAKALHLMPRSSKMNPEGRSILRNAYRPWFFKTRMEEIEAIGIERDLAGLPVAFLPVEYLLDTATADEKSLVQSLRTFVTQVRRDKTEGGLFPMEYDANGKLKFDFRLMATGGARQFNTNDVVTRYDQRIAMTVLADFILLGTQEVGSWALSSDKTNLFSQAIGTWLNVIADEMNNRAIPDLFFANAMPMDKLPRFAFGDIETPPLSEIADYVSKLSGANFPLFPNPELEDHLMELASFPEITDDVRAMQEEQKQAEMEMQLQGQMDAAAAGEESKANNAPPPPPGTPGANGAAKKPAAGARRPTAARPGTAKRGSTRSASAARRTPSSNGAKR